MKVLLVDDSASTRQLTAAWLREYGFPTIEAVDGLSALHLFETESPDLILLDIEMPGMNGYDVARAMRAIEGLDNWIPIVFLSGRASDEDVERGINAGGDDYLIKPISPMVLRAKLLAMQRITEMRRRLVQMSTELRMVNRSLVELSSLDSLTGIANRRTLDGALARAWGQAQREQRPLTLLMCDVDYFKSYNDHYGHQAGDECLRAIAHAIVSAVRSGDIVTRYGGEEFAVLLPDADARAAMTIGERVLQAVRELARPHAGSSIADCVSLSIGAAVGVPPDSLNADVLVRVADGALYRAKSQGRNCACVDDISSAVGGSSAAAA